MKRSGLVGFKLFLISMGGVLAMYSAWCIAFLHYNIGNYLPGALGALMIAVAIFLDKIAEHTATGLGLFVRYAVVLCCSLALAGMVVLVAAIHSYSGNVPHAGHNAVIILGGGLVDDEKPHGFRARVYTALEYLLENEQSVAVVSGGQGARDSVSAAYAMRRHLVLNGLDEERILIEDRARTTLENFRFSKELLDAHFYGQDYSVVYVSNSFHMPRARILARREGLVGEGMAAPSQLHMLPNYLSREYLAFVLMVVRIILE